MGKSFVAASLPTTMGDIRLTMPTTAQILNRLLPRILPRRQVGVAVQGRVDIDGKLGHRGAEGNNGATDNQRGNIVAPGNRRAAINQVMRATYREHYARPEAIIYPFKSRFNLVTRAGTMNMTSNALRSHYYEKVNLTDRMDKCTSWPRPPRHWEISRYPGYEAVYFSLSLFCSLFPDAVMLARRTPIRLATSIVV